MSACPFCPENWPNLAMVERMGVVDRPVWMILTPLNPVTLGHVLVISSRHTEDAAADSALAGDLCAVAANYVSRHRLQANIITSVGPAATQSVRHTHVHVVPRRDGDGLLLPWTLQHATEDQQ